MSNIPTVQGIYESFGKGDIPAILDVLADDVEWEAWADRSAVQAGVPWMRPRHGKAEVAGFFEVNLPTFGGGHYRDEEIHLWSFDESGKVSRLRHYTDTAKHIAALRR